MAAKKDSTKSVKTTKAAAAKVTKVAKTAKAVKVTKVAKTAKAKLPAIDDFHETPVEDFVVNPLEIIGKDWMLVAAKKGSKVNAMTASWGGIGTMWNKSVVFVVIRETRYTKEFIDASSKFTLNFFAPAYRSDLAYFGKVSGRDEDKIAKTGLKVSTRNAAPVFDDAERVLICKKLFAQPFDKNSFIDKTLVSKFYKVDAMHTLYIAEIEKILEKEV